MPLRPGLCRRPPGRACSAPQIYCLDFWPLHGGKGGEKKGKGRGNGRLYEKVGKRGRDGEGEKYRGG